MSSAVIKAAQKFFQSGHAYVHKKTGADKVTSYVIPLAMAGTTSVLWARGMLNLYTGANKLEDRAS